MVQGLGVSAQGSFQVSSSQSTTPKAYTSAGRPAVELPVSSSGAAQRGFRAPGCVEGELAPGEPGELGAGSLSAVAKLVPLPPPRAVVLLRAGSGGASLDRLKSATCEQV